jgi:hypothetical protein
VVATRSIGDLPVGSVQLEVPRQLIRRRISGKTGIALPLLIGQVAGGHIVRNLGDDQELPLQAGAHPRSWPGSSGPTEVAGFVETAFRFR